MRLRGLASAALAAYSIGPARLSPLAHLENTTFLVEARGGRYVLRIHRTTGAPWHPARRAAEVRSELQWLDALRRETDLAVPEPVSTRDGSPLTVVESAGVPEPRVCVLLRWVGGRFLSTSLTASHLVRVGRLMAQLHTQAMGFTPPDGFVRWHREDLSEDVSGAIEQMVGDCCGSEDAALVATVLEGVRRTQRALGEGAEAYGLIHGDLHQENYLFDGGRVGIIDFDDCGWGHLLADFATTLSEVNGRPDTAALHAGLLRGYQELRPLPAGFDECLPAFLAYREVQLTLWVLELRNHPAFGDWQRLAGEGFELLRTLAPQLA